MMGVSPTVQGSALTAYTGSIGPICQSGPSTRVSSALIAGAVTLAGAPAWRHIAGIQTAPVDGGAIVANIAGGVLIRPQYAVGFTVLSTAGTTPLWGWTFTYAELELDAV